MINIITELVDNGWTRRDAQSGASLRLRHTTSGAHISIYVVGRNTFNKLVFNVMIAYEGSVKAVVCSETDIISVLHPYTTMPTY